MLRFLRIARLAVIDTAEVEFRPGLNVLTGETGAGKSILVGAVSLLLGGRASGDLVRTGEEVATIEAIFENPAGEELIIRREITAQGRSRAFVNGALVTAGALKDLASGLVELHGQHEHQILLDPATHMQVLDGFGGLESVAGVVRERFEVYRQAREALERARQAARERDVRLDIVRFQLGELDRAQVVPGEDAALLTTRQVLSSAERLERLCAESYGALYERDGSIVAELGGVWRRVGELAAIDPQFQPYLDARDGIKSQLDDLAMFLSRYADRIESSPERLQQTEERLALLERLKRKYGPTLADVIARRDALAQELDDLDRAEERVSALDAEVSDARARYLDAASRLSEERQAAGRKFSKALERELADLAMEQTRFEVRFAASPLPEDRWSAGGIDELEFFVSPNPGEELRPLARIVSGGELSRIMLAIKTLAVVAGRREGVTAMASGVIFDEVDAGIGGRVADVVGRKLASLGERFQVLWITHLPQIAAYASTHFHIAKMVEKGRTRTTVVRLESEGRVDEIGRMLAGGTLSDQIRASARELLSRGAQGPAKGESKPKGESERAKAKDRKRHETRPS
ncbi:MAG: DNA repair protein RecN [Vicinamibacterales bacterium]